MTKGYYRFIRGCASKRRFRTELDAMSKGRKYNQHAYECTCCGGWHLTSKSNETSTQVPNS